MLYSPKKKGMDKTVRWSIHASPQSIISPINLRMLTQNLLRQHPALHTDFLHDLIHIRESPQTHIGLEDHIRDTSLNHLQTVVIEHQSPFHADRDKVPVPSHLLCLLVGQIRPVVIPDTHVSLHT